MKKYLLPVAALGIFGAAALLASVKVDYSHHTNFEQFHTYSWLNIKASDSLWQDRIARAVDSQLEAKGWMKVPSGGDVSVAAYGATHTEQNLNTFYTGLGGGWFWGGLDGEAETTVQNVPVGTLMVDMFNSQDKKLIWRASSSETLSNKPEKNEKKLDSAVDDMFKHFPPQSRG
jgi:hypothetical protein